MTENELSEDNQRLLVEYADNERIVACLQGRFEDVAHALRALMERRSEADLHKAEDAMRRCGAAEVARFGQALKERERLQARLRQTEYAHMILSPERE
ncbi:MAG: hypothetical protein OXC19_07045 [Bryobacterales bacterium]|nr:hypothetical protein [Bryobacterales bacterium]